MPSSMELAEVIFGSKNAHDRRSSVAMKNGSWFGGILIPKHLMLLISSQFGRIPNDESHIFVALYI